MNSGSSVSRESMNCGSSVFTSWFKFQAKELKGLILSPDRVVCHRNLPNMFRKYYPNFRVILDCIEAFMETSSYLVVAAQCWSDYKHHHTINFLLALHQMMVFLSSLMFMEEELVVCLLFGTVALLTTYSRTIRSW